ncbi:hypothetical protein [Chamaesiphon sp. VAR_48_metabat_135_sub]|uniref:hypothetical protein n=1 Tax=Chamaesiphon sp. VAR_48_metabat_135_sub TaxID=2964699 RepID=UPI00286A96DF|nr:hypothetical protein [Chamaesiphon sp. VAR_48_metabat_135_sub]
MNNIIPLKFRSLAAFLYAIGMIPVGSIIILSFNNIIGSRDLNSIGFTLIIYAIIFGFQTAFAALVVSGLLWLLTKPKHPFVDRSGRYAFHYALNALIARVFYIFILSMTCSAIEQYVNGTFMAVCLVIASCIEIAYFLNSAIASIFALRGYHFENGFITPFIQPE